ncbi:hypothetical protein [Metabacillus endolithicus]|uniref:DUF1540 domain-containing protein n=1 Tax=Metabacillus endolithicus TaxID=1535204 RepID=A0ABW5C4T2_9BACI|nr:hypothetical protein [Metabacillus endolithicus]UPG63888.1 hypothetical protein MVE64_01655 [Metabacillus endolithicus]
MCGNYRDSKDDEKGKNAAIIQNSGNSKNCINVYADSKAKQNSIVKAKADQEQEQEQEIDF